MTARRDRKRPAQEAQHLNAIVPLGKIGGVPQFTINDEDGEEEMIYESVMSQDEVTIRKVTIDLRVKDGRSIDDSQPLIKAFADNGASCTGCGAEVASVLDAYRYDKCATSITAGGMDSKATGVYYKSSICYIVPIITEDFNLRTGKPVKRCIKIRVWNLSEAIPANMLILGRDSLDELKIGAYAAADIKQLVYITQTASSLEAVIGDVEEALERMEYRGAGQPGIYSIAANNVVKKMHPLYVRCSEFELARKRRTPAVINVYELETVQHANRTSFKLKRAEQDIHPDRARRLNQKRESYVADNVLFYVIEDAQMHDGGGDDVMVATTPQNTTKSGVSYPAILDELTYASHYTTEQIEKHKFRLIPIASVFAATAWDIGLVETKHKFAIHIRDESKLKVQRRPLRPNKPADEAIMRAKFEHHVQANLGMMQEQHDAATVVRHTGSGARTPGRGSTTWSWTQRRGSWRRCACRAASTCQSA